MEKQTPGLQLGRIRPRRPARAHEPRDAREGAAGHRRGEGGPHLLLLAAARLSRRPGAQPAPRAAAPRRHARATASRIFCLRSSEDNPNMTDVVCDDLVLLTLQYSTQWDSFAHVGSRFDADGDGKAELVFYNGFRAGEDIVPAAEKKSEGMGPLRGHRREGARHPEPRRARRAGPRRADRSASPFSDDKRHAVGYDDLMRILEKDKVRGREGRHGVPVHRLRRRAAGDEEEARRRSCCTRPAPASTAATRSCCSGSPTRASPACSPTTTRSS